MEYSVIFVYTNPRTQEKSIATQWTSFVTRFEAEEWAKERISKNYGYVIRGLCKKEDWLTPKSLFVNLGRLKPQYE